MLESSAPDDEAGRFLSVYDVIGGSDSETTPVSVDQNVQHASVAASDNNTRLGSELTAPVISTRSVTSVPADIKNSPLPATADTAPVSSDTAPASPTASQTAPTPDVQTTDNVKDNAKDNINDSATGSTNINAVKRSSPSRWIVTGAIVGVSLGFMQSNPDIMHRAPVTAVASAPQMLTAADADAAASFKPDTVADAISVEVSSLITGELTNARRYFDRTGTFTGWRPAAPLLGATGGPYVVVVVDIDGTCYSTGIAPGYDNGIDIDPTGGRCDINSLNKLQQTLDSIG